MDKLILFSGIMGILTITLFTIKWPIGILFFIFAMGFPILFPKTFNKIANDNKYQIKNH